MSGKVRDGAATGATGASGAVAVVDTVAGATVSDEVRATDGSGVKVEGTSGAAAAAAEALAFGGAGAGVGGSRIVEAVEGIATQEMPLVGVGHAGDRRGTFDRPAIDAGRADSRLLGELTDIASGRRPEVTGAAGRAVEFARTATRPGRNAILPLAEPKLDPSLVPGVKLATAAAQVRRGGRSYAPGEKVPIDFKAHSELTAAGVIVAEPWHDMDDHDPD